MDRRIEKFTEAIAQQCPIVFCVRCGSTRVEQRTLAELSCVDCGNCLPFDGLSFSLVSSPSTPLRLKGRKGGSIVAVVSKATSLRQRTPPWMAADEVEAD